MRLSLSVKTTIYIFFIILLLVSLTLWVVYQQTVAMKVKELQGNLLITAKLTASLIDADLHSEIPLNSDGVQKPQYQELRKRLMQIQADHPFIRYIYTLAKNEKGDLCFVVDAAKRDDLFSYPGDKYAAEKLGREFEDFVETEVHNEIITDKWGTFISGYSPIKDVSGEVKALLGVDMSLDVVSEAKEVIWKTFIYILILNFFLSLLIGALAASRIIRPIRKLSEGTQIIAGGNLKHQVDLKRNDEIGELAQSFNLMTRSLAESYHELKKSFINAIKALTVALEAKDPYTKGHALRVGRYSLLIAKEMNVPESDLENLEALSAMHDIGKIGIKDEVLLKRSPLNEEEREIMRQHPLIGEEILKPLAYFEPDLLKLIRWHHERPDGTGYPDGLKGDEIPVLVLIVAVADAYDAMITNRPYRKGMPPEEAFKELEKHAGKEYDARVIAALKSVVERGEANEAG